MSVGVYQIKSILKPDRFYIGSSSTIDKRWYEHLRVLRLGKHHSIQLQRHFNKYGESDLQFCILLECNADELIVQEQEYIDKLTPFFNCSQTAGSPLGVKRSEETKEKQRNLKLGIKQSRETIEKRCKKLRGRKMPKSFIDYLKTRVYSEEWKHKISLSKMGNKYGCGHHRKLSEEHKKKLSISHIGKIPSKETRAKLSESGKRAWILRKLKKIHDENISITSDSGKLSVA